MRILIDVDGPLAKFMEGVHDKVEEATTRRPAPDDMPWIDFNEDGGLTYAPWGVENCPIVVPGFCLGLEMVEDAAAAITQLRRQHEVCFVTAQMNVGTWAHERQRWLKDGLDASQHDIVFTHAKHLIVGDVIIEDNIRNIDNWKKHHPNGTAILWDMPYNREARGYSRARSWLHIIAIVEALANVRRNEKDRGETR